MVISIMLIICIPLTLGVGGFFILKAYEMGVKSQKEEVEKDREAKFDIVEFSEDEKKYMQEMINEYTGL